MKLALVKLVAIAAAIGSASVSGTDTPTITVQHDGVAAFCATSLGSINGSTWNFTGTCSTPPPFNPPNDPNALNGITGQFMTHTCSGFATNDGQNFASVFGKGEGQSAIVPIWPFRPNTSVKFSLPAHGRYYGGASQMPANPGVSRHYLKGDPYGGSCGAFTTPGARVNVRVVPVGATPAFTGVCSKTAAPFDGGAWVTINPSGFNSTMCNVPPLSTYRYIVENAGSTPISALMTWN